MQIIALNTSTFQTLRVHRIQHKRQTSVEQRIAFSTREGLYIVPVSSIIHCVAMDNYCQIFRKDASTITIAKTLKSIDATLAPYGFLRVHKSHLVDAYEIMFTGPDFLTLSDGTEVPVSRANRQLVMDRVMINVKMVE